MKLLDILLVDDDHDDCGLFAIAVDQSGLNIRLQIVTDGEQAIDYLEGRGVYADRSLNPLPALVLLDLNTRLTGGFGFLDWRRASASFSSLPVLIFSDFGYEGRIETAMAMGTSAFIAKPAELEGWEAVVRRIWDIATERSQPAKPLAIQQARHLRLAADGPDAQAALLECQAARRKQYG